MNDFGLLTPGSARAPGLDDQSFLEAMVQVETAWGVGQESVGLCTPAQVAEIREVGLGGQFDLAQLGAECELGGNPVIPLLAVYRAQLSVETAKVLHRTLTSQDIIDTTLMLITARSRSAVLAHLDSCVLAMSQLADQYRHAPMAARTLGQLAEPTTFGLKAAIWCSQVATARDLVRAIKPMVSWGGAAGTGRALCELTNEPDRAVRTWADALSLGMPSHPWHVDRTPVLAIASAFGATCASLGKVANDVLTLTRDEVAELREPHEDGQGASSSMPHKQNSVLSVLIRRSALSTPQWVAQLHTCAALSVDERPDGAWHAEWQPWRLILQHTMMAASFAAQLLSGIEVREDEMAARAAVLGARPHRACTDRMIDNVITEANR